jgi:hypothetical protein
LIAPEKRPLIDHTPSAIAEPTMECMFGSGKPRQPDAIPKHGIPELLPPHGSGALKTTAASDLAALADTLDLLVDRPVLRVHGSVARAGWTGCRCAAGARSNAGTRTSAGGPAAGAARS